MFNISNYPKYIITLLAIVIVLDSFLGMGEDGIRIYSNMLNMVSFILCIFILYKIKMKDDIFIRTLILYSIMIIISTIFKILNTSFSISLLSRSIQYIYWSLFAIMMYKLGYSTTKHGIYNKYKDYFLFICRILLIFLVIKTIYMGIFHKSFFIGSKSFYIEFLIRNPYLIAWLTPLLFLWKSKYNIYIAAIAVFAILLTSKRGPLVCIGLSCIPLIPRLKFPNLLKYTIIATILGGILIAYNPDVIETFLERWDPSNSKYASSDAEALTSSRSTIWSILLRTYSQGNLFQFFFGMGFNSTTEITGRIMGIGIFAHNDWIELLVNWGILGVVLFLILHIYYFYTLFIKCKKIKSTEILTCRFIYMMYILANFYTQAICGVSQSFIFIFTAFYLGRIHYVNTKKMNKYPQQYLTP